MTKTTLFILKNCQKEAMTLKELLEQHQYNVVGVAHDYQDALKKYKKLSIDIMIIDMFLHNKPDGILFIEKISTTQKNICPFIFLADFQKQHLYHRAKQTNPFAILHKPLNEIAIRYTLENIIEQFYEQPDEQINIYHNSGTQLCNLFIKKKNALHKVAQEDIIYIEVENRYCNIITEEEKFVVLISLGKVKEFLNANIFLQVHRKYIINQLAIEQIIPKDNLIVLRGDYKVTLGIKYKSILKSFNIIR